MSTMYHSILQLLPKLIKIGYRNIHADKLSDNCPVGIYLSKVYNRNIRTRCEICSELTSELERHQNDAIGCYYC